ncbi:hypothetical protein [Desulfurobacterium sp. TC5-1]|uniref:hypothetical protein n=1 Tax=Desulfurobacterium sp. TC5-1 TaxID=1158318 RepID=UPI0003B4C5B6|nr:hypothetical protein [Desulfurobacterium sp. TC5-1]
MRYRYLTVALLFLKVAYGADFNFQLPSSKLSEIKSNSTYRSVTSKDGISSLTGRVNATVSCPVVDFLKVKLKEVSGNKEIYVYVDTNFDGSYDKVQVFRGVSAICDDGFIKCAGAFPVDSCSFYPVSFVNGTFVVGSAEEYKRGCYCIQSSCGISLDSILQTAGGFFAGTYSKAGIEVSNGTIDSANATIYYRAANPVCEGNVDELKSYYSDPSGLDEAAEDIRSGNRTVEESGTDLWEKVARPAESSVPDEYRCDISVNVSKKVVTKTDTCPSGITKDIGGMLYCFLGKSPTYTTERDGPATFNLGVVELKGYQNLYAVLVRDDYDWYRNNYKFIEAYKDGVLLGRFVNRDEIWSNNWVWGTIVYTNENFKDETGSFSFRFYCQDDGKTGVWSGHLEVWKSMNYQTDELTYTVSNTCHPPANCTLKDETYCDWNNENCFKTVNNTIEYSISVPASCRTIDLSNESWKLCAVGTEITGLSDTGERLDIDAPWWNIHRVYTCPSDSSGTSIDTSFLDSMTYDNGTGVLTAGWGNFTSEMGNETCNQYCKVKTVQEEAQGTSDTVKENEVTEIRLCADGRCPVKPGETVVENCTCNLSPDLDTLITIQALDAARKDVICSKEAP